MKKFLKKIAEPFMFLQILDDGTWVCYKYKLFNTIVGRKPKAYEISKNDMENFSIWSTICLLAETLIEYIIQAIFSVHLGLKFGLLCSAIIFYTLTYLFFIKNNEQI